MYFKFPFLFLLCLESLICIDWPTLYYLIDALYCFHVFFLFFFFFFWFSIWFSVCCSDWVFPLFYLLSHLFSPLHYSFFSSVPLTHLVSLQISFLIFLFSSFCSLVVSKVICVTVHIGSSSSSIFIPSLRFHF